MNQQQQITADQYATDSFYGDCTEPFSGSWYQSNGPYNSDNAQISYQWNSNQTVQQQSQVNPTETYPSTNQEFGPVNTDSAFDNFLEIGGPSYAPVVRAAELPTVSQNHPSTSQQTNVNANYYHSGPTATTVQNTSYHSTPQQQTNVGTYSHSGPTSSTGYNASYQQPQTRDTAVYQSSIQPDNSYRSYNYNSYNYNNYNSNAYDTNYQAYGNYNSSTSSNSYPNWSQTQYTPGYQPQPQSYSQEPATISNNYFTNEPSYQYPNSYTYPDSSTVQNIQPRPMDLIPTQPPQTAVSFPSPSVPPVSSNQSEATLMYTYITDYLQSSYDETNIENLDVPTQLNYLSNDLSGFPQADRVPLQPTTEFESDLNVPVNQLEMPELARTKRPSPRKKTVLNDLGPYACDHKNCEVEYKTMKNLDRHKRCHRPTSAKFTCYVCKVYKSRNWTMMAGHLWNDHKINLELHKCEQCDYHSYSLSIIKEVHQRIHKAEKETCPICSKTFTTKKELNSHRKRHKIKSKDELRCKLCDRVLSDLRAKRVHEAAVHKKLRPYPCNMCEFTGQTRSILRRHKLQHTGEKPYRCNICEYSTIDHNSLRRHKMRHTGEKAYHCPYCDYGCIQSATYKLHINTAHPDQSDEVVYSCSCGFKSVNKDNYKVHLSENKHLPCGQRESTKLEIRKAPLDSIIEHDSQSSSISDSSEPAHVLADPESPSTQLVRVLCQDPSSNSQTLRINDIESSNTC